MDQSAAPCDRSLPSYRNCIVVSRTKCNITPFSRLNVPHSQSIVQVINVKGVMYVFPRQHHLDKPLLIPLGLDLGLCVSHHESPHTSTLTHAHCIQLPLESVYPSHDHLMLIGGCLVPTYFCLKRWITELCDCCVHLHSIMVFASKVLHVGVGVVGLDPRISIRCC